MAINARANEQMGITLPPGWVFEYPKNQEKYSAQTIPSIQYHDTKIARSMLMQWINLGSQETGSYNLADVQMRVFLEAMQAHCNEIEEVINDEIERLVDYNYNNVETYPTLKAGKVALADVTDVATALNKLANMPVPLVHPDPQIEDFLRDSMGLPAAPQSVVEATNPTAEATPERPETQPASHEDAQSANKSGTPAPEAPAALSELATEIRLWREAMDAVGRGERHRRG
jgi:hypothetical protein